MSRGCLTLWTDSAGTHHIYRTAGRNMREQTALRDGSPQVKEQFGSVQTSAAPRSSMTVRSWAAERSNPRLGCEDRHVRQLRSGRPSPKMSVFSDFQRRPSRHTMQRPILQSFFCHTVPCRPICSGRSQEASSRYQITGLSACGFRFRHIELRNAGLSAVPSNVTADRMQAAMR